ncbi:quinone oxidoreductase family protein [Longispora urticae]
MRAIVVYQTGGPEVLTPTEWATPAPGPGQVLIDVAAIGVNYHDLYERSALYPREVPFLPGLECAGTVAALGAGVTGIAVGDLVVTMEASPGAYAERVVAPADRVVPVPAGVTAEQAAAVYLQGLTAHYLTRDSRPVRPGETVLVHAAAGGLGLLLTQLLRRDGARVIGTVSSAAKEAAAREAGAHEVIRYTEVDFVAEIGRLTEGRGVDVVYDGVGEATFAGSVRSLRPGGTLLHFGQPSGWARPEDVEAGRSAPIELIQPSVVDFIVTREALVARAEDIFSWLLKGEVTLHEGQKYPLADAVAAHSALEARGTIGKVLLVP